jgi:hypothetical protein
MGNIGTEMKSKWWYVLFVATVAAMIYVFHLGAQSFMLGLIAGIVVAVIFCTTLMLAFASHQPTIVKVLTWTYSIVLLVVLCWPSLLGLPANPSSALTYVLEVMPLIAIANLIGLATRENPCGRN